VKFNARSALILLLILALSVGFGFAYDGIATALERNKYPLNERYADDIRAAAEEYAIPEAIVWATVCTESGFSGDLVGEDGGQGVVLYPANNIQNHENDHILEQYCPTGQL
jgi:hypothetical protein